MTIIDEPRTEEVLVSLVKCKYCGKIIEKHNLRWFSYKYADHEYRFQ